MSRDHPCDIPSVQGGPPADYSLIAALLYCQHPAVCSKQDIITIIDSVLDLIEADDFADLLPSSPAPNNAPGKQ
jgi:hypothetical protein